jgi:pilus assembly protein CpaD
MEKMMKNVILTLGLCFSLAACGGFNGREDALSTVQFRHPISVDPQVVTLQIDAPRDKVALSVADKAALNAFAGTYRARGHGLLSIAAPSGSPNERAAVALVAETRAVLAERGMKNGELGYAAYRASSANDDAPLILTYRRYVASASPCGNWSENLGDNPDNSRSPNFGCSTQNNLAALVEDPADLLGPREWDPAYAPRRDQVIENYRTGEVTEAEQSGNASGNVSEVAE